jgi:hypothetical protein
VIATVPLAADNPNWPAPEPAPVPAAEPAPGTVPAMPSTPLTSTQ